MFQLWQGDSPSLGGVLHAGGGAGRERGGEGGSGRWEDPGQVGIHAILLQEDVPFPCGSHRQTSQLQYLQDRPEGIVNDFVTLILPNCLSFSNLILTTTKQQCSKKKLGLVIFKKYTSSSLKFQRYCKYKFSNDIF